MPVVTSSNGMTSKVRWELLDLVFLSYIVAVCILLLVFGVGLGRHPHPWHLILYHMALACAGLGARTLPHIWDHPVSWFLRWWYPAFLFLFCFEAVGHMTHLIIPDYIDVSLVSADRTIFGTDLTPWFQNAAHPWLTEIMYFCYTAFYFFIPGIGIPLYLRWRGDRVLPEATPFREYLAVISVIFLGCYLHFLFTPAGGPVFYADYPGPVLKLHGGPITALEQWIFDNGTIVGGAFPSSHVAAAIATAIYAVRYRIAPWFFAPVAVGMGMSTVYNGYHYGVDVLYGMIIAILVVVVVPPLFHRYERRLNRSVIPLSGGL